MNTNPKENIDFKITNLALNKYIKIKEAKEPQCLVDDYYDVAKEELLDLIKRATVIFSGLSKSEQDIYICVDNPFVLVVAQDSNVIIDVILVNKVSNPMFNALYVEEVLKELKLLLETVVQVTTENKEKDIINNQKISEKNNEIKKLRDKMKVLEDERDKYLSNIQFNKKEVSDLLISYTNTVREFTGVDII